MKTPVRIGVIAMVSNMILNVIFVVPLHFFWQIGHVGLALATSASALINAGLLFSGLRKGKIFRVSKGWRLFFARISVANILMIVSLLVIAQYLPDFAALHWIDRSRYLAIYVGGGGIAYLSTLVLMGLRLRDLRLVIE